MTMALCGHITNEVFVSSFVDSFSKQLFTGIKDASAANTQETINKQHISQMVNVKALTAMWLYKNTLVDI